MEIVSLAVNGEGVTGNVIDVPGRIGIQKLAVVVRRKP